MPTDKRSAEFELLARLRRSSTLRAIGCDATRGLTGAVCLTMSKQMIGTWWYEQGEFRFALIAHGVHSIEVPTAEQAVARSIELATRQIVATSNIS